jgi:hypothetical protein
MRYLADEVAKGRHTEDLISDFYSGTAAAPAIATFRELDGLEFCVVLHSCHDGEMNERHTHDHRQWRD